VRTIEVRELQYKIQDSRYGFILDIYVCSCDVCTSRILPNVQLEMAMCLMHLKTRGTVLFYGRLFCFGDFNARTCREADYCVDDDSPVSDLCSKYITDIYIYTVLPLHCLCVHCFLKKGAETSETLIYLNLVPSSTFRIIYIYI
jgi:hypothetical protein